MLELKIKHTKTNIGICIWPNALDKQCKRVRGKLEPGN